jgi:hypothetical protein
MHRIQTYLKLGVSSCLQYVMGQYLAHFSGEVAASNTREYGRANLSYIKENEVSLKVFQ